MKRSPLKRKSPMRCKPRSTRYSRRERDIPRMLWTKTLPCMLRPEPPFRNLWHGPAESDGCRGVVEAHHAGEHAGWQKAPDDTVIPMCDYHHDCLGDRQGVFSGWPKFALKAWELAAVEHYQALYAARTAVDAPY